MAADDLRTYVQEWDYRQQPDLEALADKIRDLSGGRLHLALVDTCSDQYALVLSTIRLDPAAAQIVWEEATGHDA